MNNDVSITLVNGLGDKLLDMVGLCILCKYLNYTPKVTFCNRGNFAWGNSHYDSRLINFNDVTISDDKCDFFVCSLNPSSSLCPYKVYEFIQQFIPEITFEQISTDFFTFSRKIITPSEIISSNIPSGIEDAYGIHLRKSDRVTNHGDIRHDTSYDEFEIITTKLLEDVQHIINTVDDAKFVIVSEDDDWKNEITNRIKASSNKEITIIDVVHDNESKYSNYNSVLDMFCLSKCRAVLQGVKYSTFSILASILGNNKLVNYSKYTDSYDSCLIHSWSSVLELNGSKNFDIELHKQITKDVATINTNIIQIHNYQSVSLNVFPQSL